MTEIRVAADLPLATGVSQRLHLSRALTAIGNSKRRILADYFASVADTVTVRGTGEEYNQGPIPSQLSDGIRRGFSSRPLLFGHSCKNETGCKTTGFVSVSR
jgi:hypothetical protein